MSNILKICGIYKIINIKNLKFYIGSSIDCKKRNRSHFSELSRNKHANKKLQNAWNKYGKTNFIFEVIEIVNNPLDLLIREQHYLDTLKPNYNICKVAGNTLGIKLTQEHKKKISDNLKDKYSGENSFNYKGGYKKPKNKLESNDLIIIIETTLTSRQSIKSGKIVIQYDNEMNILKEWSSIKLASDTLNIRRHSIKDCCEGKSRHAGFFIWRFKGNENIEYTYRENNLLQLDENGVIIDEFEQIVIAAEKLKITRNGISKALKTGKTYCGFYWKYKNNNINKIK